MLAGLAGDLLAASQIYQGDVRDTPQIQQRLVCELIAACGEDDNVMVYILYTCIPCTIACRSGTDANSLLLDDFQQKYELSTTTTPPPPKKKMDNFMEVRSINGY